MNNAFVELVRELRGTVRARRQEKIREVELSWSASELAGFRLFVAGLHSSEMADVCYALSDAQAAPLLEILGDLAERDTDLMKIAFQAMEKTSGHARIFLARRLIDSLKPEVRARTCEMLDNCGRQAAPLLERALEDHDPGVQQAAIGAVSRGAFKKLLPRLIPALRGGDRGTRLAALEAFARLGCDSSALSNDLLKILKDTSQDERARRLAAGILARASSAGGRSALLDALRDGAAEKVLRVAAAESLCAYDDPVAINAVLRAVDDRDPGVAKTARMSLSRKQSRAFAGILGQYLGDTDLRIAELAAELLGGLDASMATGILMGALKNERRVPVVTALAQAMGKGGIPGAWNALLSKREKEKINSPEFFSALADVAEEKNLEEFASLFDKVNDAEARRTIMERLALFARSTAISPAIEALAERALNGSDKSLYLPASAVLAHTHDLDQRRRRLVLERLADYGDDPRSARAVAAMTRGRGGALADIFLDAPPAAAGLLARAASDAAFLGDRAEPLFRMAAKWARNGVPHAPEALRALSSLAPEALVRAMSKCPNQIFLLEAWSCLPEQERLANQPDFQAFFSEADPVDSLAGIRILKNLQDPRALDTVADLAFTSRHPEVRKAALALTRELILAR